MEISYAATSLTNGHSILLWLSALVLLFVLRSNAAHRRACSGIPNERQHMTCTISTAEHDRHHVRGSTGHGSTGVGLFGRNSVLRYTVEGS